MTDRAPSPVHLFAYGSLVSAASAERTLGRGVEPCPLARLAGWRRRWSQVRDNVTTEKTFAHADTGAVPPHCLGLNIELDPGAEGPNGVLLEVTEAELERLAVREIRYDRIDVTEAVEADSAAELGRVFSFTAKAENFAPTPPPGAVILAQYVRAVEAAFEGIGSGELERFRSTTGPLPVETMEAVLVRDEIPPGNPRDW